MGNTASYRSQTPRRVPHRLPAPEIDTGLPKPFLKWVGGKTQLLDRLLPLLPDRFGRYHEPFLGGGAVFFALVRKKSLGHARLTDINRELVETYTALRDQSEEVIVELSKHRYDSEYYYDVRERDPWTLSVPERAARMIYLNRCGFNGLYRVNKRGRFNVPFGRHTNPRICDGDNLRAVARALDGVCIEHAPFASVLESARSGDLVYFDPPYVPVSRTANFVAYAQDGFGSEDQETLAEICETLSQRGVHVVLSNSDTRWVRERYAAFDVRRVPARRSVNSNPQRRGPVSEVVVVG